MLGTLFVETINRENERSPLTLREAHHRAEGIVLFHTTSVRSIMSKIPRHFGEQAS